MIAESLFALSILFGIISMIGYGLTDVLSSILTKKDSAIKLTFWYFLLSGIILAFMSVLLFGFPKISNSEAILLTITSFLSVFGLLAFFKSLKVGKLSIVAPISGSWSIITVLIGVLFLNEALSTLQILGVILIILGTILTSFKLKDMLNLKLDKLVPGSGYAIMAMLIWGVFYAAVGILSKQLGWLYPIFIVTLGSAILLLIYSLIKRVDLSFPTKLSGLLLLWVVIGTIAFAFYGLGVNYGYISLVSPIAAAAPFIAVILSVLLFKEKLEINEVVGIIFIIIGLVAIAY